MSFWIGFAAGLAAGLAVGATIALYGLRQIEKTGSSPYGFK